MSIEQQRLLSLLEFAQQSARLRSTPAHNVSQHKFFALYEHQLQGLPGVRLNLDGIDSEDELWLSVSRLHEIKPPEVNSAILYRWIKISPSPAEEPTLLEEASGADPISSGTHRSSH